MANYDPLKPERKSIPKKLIIGAGSCLLLIGISMGIYVGTAPKGNIKIEEDEIQENEPYSNLPSGSSTNPTASPHEYVNSYVNVGCIQTPIEAIANTAQATHNLIILKEDYVYGKGAVENGEKDLKLDIYHPPLEQDNVKYPLMIHIHGGSFTGGRKGDGYMKSLSEFWAKRGFVVASIDYRLLGDSPVLSDTMKPVYEYAIAHLSEVWKTESQAQAATCAIEDTLTAYEYLKGLPYVDSEQVVMNGYSAGAIIALWATYGVDNYDITSPPVKAVLSHWGLLATDREETETLVPKKNGEAPAFLVHATGDGIVPYFGTQYLANQLQYLDIPYALHCEDSGSHTIGIDTTIHSDDMSILDAELVWLQNILYG